MTTESNPADATPDLILKALEEAFAISRRWLDPAAKLRTTLEAAGIDPSSDEALPARLATGFFLDFPMPGRRVQPDSMEFFDGHAPLKPRDCSEDVAGTWERIADTTTVLSLRATLYDLLAQRGGRMVPHHAFCAIRAYCDLVERPYIGIDLDDGTRTAVKFDDLDLALALARALALSLFNPRPSGADPGEPDQVQRAVSLTLERVKTMSGTDEMPGVFVMLTEQLLLEKQRLSEDQLTQLKAILMSRFDTENSPDLVDSLATFLRRLDARPLEDLNTRRVQVRIDRASDVAPMVAMSLLQEAHNLARDIGLSALSEESIRQIQALRTADFGWKSLSSTVTIGRELMETQVRRWSRGANAIEALDSWGMSPPPTGDAEAARDAALARASEPSLMNTLNRQIFAADGLPYLTISTLEERTYYELSVADEMAFGLNGQLLAEALDRVVTYGMPSDAALLDFLIGAGETQFRPIAQDLSTALFDYWRGAYEAAAARAIPKIEAAIRQLVLLLNEPAYITARTGSRGKYAGIDQLLPLLAAHGFDSNWDHALRAFCLGPYGMNVRNDFAHGFQLRMHPRILAALSIRFLLLLVRIGGTPDITPSATEPFVPPISVSSAIEQTLRYAATNPSAVISLLRREVIDAKQSVARMLRSRWTGPTA